MYCLSTACSLYRCHPCQCHSEQKRLHLPTNVHVHVVLFYVLLNLTRNVMAHAQKPELGFLRNGRVHLNRRGGQFSRLLAAEVCASAVVMVIMLDTPCSEAECKTAGYPLHSPVSPSLPLPCVTVCHQIPRAL